MAVGFTPLAAMSSIDFHAKAVTGGSAPSSPTSPFTMDAKQAFMDVYPEIQRTLLADSKATMMTDDNRVAYLTKLMDTTCLGGKYNRGITVVEVATALVRGGTNAGTLQKQAAVCGWAVEFMQAHFLVEDDIMDSSVTRRGKPCWYRHPGVTVQCAINDGLILLAWATKMLRHFVRQHPRFLEILEMFHHVDHCTTMGQFYDVTSMFDSAKLDPEVPQPTTTDYKEFTLDHYRRIVLFKTAYYTYHLPMLFGLAVADQLESIPADLVHKLAMTMGEYFQIQDDFLDCFGEPERIGKIGTDIQDVKCSWLAVTFLATASEKDREAFKANYGQHDEAKVAVIKDMYRKAALEKTFGAYEEEVVKSVEAQLAEIKQHNPVFSDAITALWKRTFKRSF
jgi:farnesyl diphosphate synthase